MVLERLELGLGDCELGFDHGELIEIRGKVDRFVGHLLLVSLG